MLAQLPHEERAPNFGETFLLVTGPNSATRSEPVYKVSRDGFALLAMGFINQKALFFKVAYIKAFNAMAAHIKNQREGLRFECMKLTLDMKGSERRSRGRG